MNYSCLVIDDEPLARKVIEKHLQDYPQFLLEASCENALSAFALINSKKIDLVFLDIQMPGIDGIQFIRSLKNPPAVIFTTAFSEYAADSYELEAVDYLVKPVSTERFARSIQKFLKQAPAVQKKEEKNFLFVKSDGRLTKIYHNEIDYIESRKDYLMIYTEDRPVITHMTMKAMEDLLPPALFRRVHRSYLISLQKIRSLGTNELELGKKKIPIGEKYRKLVSSWHKDKKD